MNEKKLKIGGLTWWRYNYGSILQAYALQQKLNSYENVDYEIICQYGKKVASTSNLIDKLQRYGLFVTLKKAVWKFGLKKLRKRNSKIQLFMDQNLRVSEMEFKENDMQEANRFYDGFVCGSDQVWNPQLTEMDSIYWLGFAEKGKLKFSYAPSVGVDAFSEEQEKQIRENLMSFRKVSTREETSTELINRAMGKKCCTTVLDPTLMVDRALWDKLSDKKIYDEPYIFVYMLRGTKSQRKLIEMFAKKVGLKIVTMPFLDTERIELYDFKFGDYKLWDADPAEFIEAIRYAKYVITDSFHSSVFSCLYHRTFYVFPKIGKSQLNRLTGVQKMFEIPSRMITEGMTADDLLQMPDINWVKVDEILKEKRCESRKYLDEILLEGK